MYISGEKEDDGISIQAHRKERREDRGFLLDRIQFVSQAQRRGRKKKGQSLVPVL